MSGVRTLPRRRGESGQSLIEVLAGLALLAVATLPLAAVFYTGMTSAAENRECGDAIAIADGQLAKATATTYASLGFYENQFGTPPLTIPAYNGQPAVDLGASPSGRGGSPGPADEHLRLSGGIGDRGRRNAAWPNPTAPRGRTAELDPCRRSRA